MVAMMSLRVWRDESCRTGSDLLTLDSIFTAVTVEVTGFFLPGVQPVDPRQNSARMRVDERRGVVAMGRHSRIFASW